VNPKSEKDFLTAIGTLSAPKPTPYHFEFKSYVVLRHRSITYTMKYFHLAKVLSKMTRNSAQE
jgi:hypothetical protein